MSRLLINTIGISPVLSVLFAQDDDNTQSRATVFGIEKVVTGDSDFHLWDSEKAIIPSSNKDQKCRWGKYRVADDEVDICLHEGNDAISEAVLQNGQWEDCPAVAKSYGDADDGAGDIAFDIGGNIGTCSLHLLMSHPDAKLFIFEPLATNLFVLTSTFKKLSKDRPDIADRVRIFPVGLGDAPSHQVMNNVTWNHGGSYIRSPNSNSGGSKIQNETNMMLAKSQSSDWTPENSRNGITVRSLDSLFEGSSLSSVRFAKIDVEGYECNAINGMPETIKKIDTIKSEVLLRNLKIQNVCKTRNDLVDLLEQTHATTFGESHNAIVGELTEDGELYAVRKKKLAE